MKPVYVPITMYGTPVTSEFAGKNNVQDSVLGPFYYRGLQNYVHTG
jgi:hypothetical protein